VKRGEDTGDEEDVLIAGFGIVPDARCLGNFL
jgi:hypothetical protein